MGTIWGRLPLDKPGTGHIMGTIWGRLPLAKPGTGHIMGKLGEGVIWGKTTAIPKPVTVENPLKTTARKTGENV